MGQEEVAFALSQYSELGDSRLASRRPSDPNAGHSAPQPISHSASPLYTESLSVQGAEVLRGLSLSPSAPQAPDVELSRISPLQEQPQQGSDSSVRAGSGGGLSVEGLSVEGLSTGHRYIDSEQGRSEESTQEATSNSSKSSDTALSTQHTAILAQPKVLRKINSIQQSTVEADIVSSLTMKPLNPVDDKAMNAKKGQMLLNRKSEHNIWGSNRPDAATLRRANSHLPKPELRVELPTATTPTKAGKPSPGGRPSSGPLSARSPGKGGRFQKKGSGLILQRMFGRMMNTQQEKKQGPEVDIDRISPDIKLTLAEWANRARYTAKMKALERQRMVLAPDSRAKSMWDIFMLILMMWTIFEIPVSIIFIDVDPDTACRWDLLSAANFVCDCLFLVDVIANFQTAYYDENEQELVYDRQKIATTYLKSWFLLDFASSIPVDQLLCLFNINNGAAFVRIIKTIRLLKLARLLKFQRVLRRWSVITGSRSLSNAIRFIKFGSIMIFSAHLAGCFWMLVGKSNCLAADDKDCGPNWLELYDPDLYADEHNVLSKYLVSLYFAVVTLSTVGYGDVIPANDVERIYALVLAMGGAMVFAWCIGSISDLASESNSTERAIESAVREVTDFMKFKNVPPELQFRVRHAISHSTRRAPHLVQQCLDVVPFRLRQELLLNVSSELVDSIKLFKYMDADTKAAVASMLRPVYLRSMETLYKAFETGNEMYFVASGSLNETNLENQVVERICTGDFIGEMAVFEDLLPVRCSTVGAHAGGDCEVLALRREDFQNVVRPYFPDLYQSIRDMAQWRHHSLDVDQLSKKLQALSVTRSRPVHERTEQLKTIHDYGRHYEGKMGGFSILETIRLLKQQSHSHLKQSEKDDSHGQDQEKESEKPEQCADSKAAELTSVQPPPNVLPPEVRPRTKLPPVPKRQEIKQYVAAGAPSVPAPVTTSVPEPIKGDDTNGSALQQVQDTLQSLVQSVKNMESKMTEIDDLKAEVAGMSESMKSFASHENHLKELHHELTPQLASHRNALNLYGYHQTRREVLVQGPRSPSIARLSTAGSDQASVESMSSRPSTEHGRSRTLGIFGGGFNRSFSHSFQW